MNALRLLPLSALLLSSGLVHAQASLEGRVIVRWKADAPVLKTAALRPQALPAEVGELLQRRANHLGHRAQLSLTSSGRALDARTQVLTARGLSSAALAQRLARDPQVELVAVDQIRRISAVPNDPIYANGDNIGPAVGQWYLKPPSATVASGINAQAAWDRTTGAATVTVAVIDTGVRLEHPDLAANLLPGYDMIGAGGGGSVRLAVANDGDLADADPSDPGDWVNQADITGGSLGSSCTSADISNSSWHGTRVAGLIGAVSNNAFGMAGVSWAGKILPIRALGKCGGFDSDILAGVRWAVGASVPGLPANPNPAQVLNLSLGSTGACNTPNGQLYREAFAEANARGAVVVVAAGNSAGEPVDLPANCAGAIAVTGLRHVGTKVGFSSMGPEVAVAAPGGNCVNVNGGPCLYPLVSTTNTGTTVPISSTFTYGNVSVGTSFATPLVAGAAALALALNPTLTPAQIKSLLQTTTRPFPTSGSDSTPPPPTCPAPQRGVEVLECYCTTTTCGAGMLDANALLAAVPSYSGPPQVIADVGSSSNGGTTVALSSRVAAYGGRSIASYQWGIVSGGTLASLSGSSQATATLTTSPGSAGGDVVVQLTVTDSGGQSASSQATVRMAAAPTPAPPPAPSPSPAPAPSSGGGGGSSSPLWLALLALAAGVVGPRRRVSAPPPKP